MKLFMEEREDVHGNAGRCLWNNEKIFKEKQEDVHRKAGRCS